MSKLPDYLVETDWLADNLSREDIKIFDVTGMLTSKFENFAETESYAKAHIPGAQFFDVASGKGVLSDPSGTLPWTWPSVEQVTETLQTFGINKTDAVVIYAAAGREGIDNGVMWCTRAWWILHHHGLDCAILNGGMVKWLAEGRETSHISSDPTPGDFIAKDPGAVVADKDRVRQALQDETVAVIDALPEASYDGSAKVKYGERKGHISGALSLPMGKIADPQTMAFVPLGDAAKSIEAAGITTGQAAVTYCGGGIAATMDAFTLLRLGHKDVAVYDASLMEWAQDEELPMTDPSAL